MYILENPLFFPILLTIYANRGFGTIESSNLARFMYSRFINKTRLKITELYSVKCCLTAHYSVVTDKIMKTTRIRNSQSILLLVWCTKYYKTHLFLICLDQFILHLQSYCFFEELCFKPLTKDKARIINSSTEK